MKEEDTAKSYMQPQAIISKEWIKINYLNKEENCTSNKDKNTFVCSKKKTK